MQELTNFDLVPAKITFDFDAYRAELEQEIAEYNIVVTAENVADAKKVATDLNKRKNEIDARRKAARKKAMGPIEEFDGQAKELVLMCEDGRQKILEQTRVYDQKVLAEAERLLGELRDALREQYGIDPEFHKAEFDDLIKLSSMTSNHNLTKSARDTLESRVRDEKSLQDRTKMRLLELENRSYKAGLAAPLTRDHVAHFLFADDERYESELQRILDAEVTRQQAAEKHMAERQEREARQQAEAKQEAQERDERMGRAEDAPQQPEPAPKAPEPPPAPDGKVTWTVTAIFHPTTPAGVSPEAIERELRRKLTEAGINTLSAVRVQQQEKAV